MLAFSLLSVLVFALFSGSAAVPTLRARSSISESSWRKPNVTQSLADLIDIASAALAKAIDGVSTINQFDGQTYEYVATLYCEMAQFDMITNQTQYEIFLQQSFSRTQQARPNFADEQLRAEPATPVTYGYAAIQAYLAYQNSTFLEYAIQSWSFGRSLTLSQAGTTLSGKNFTVLGSCDGATMAGGTFWTTTASDPSVAAMSTGYFMLLSALLAEATSNPSYLDAATESANFIHSHLYNSNGLVLQIVSASQNDSCKVLDDSVHSFNSGLFIEGLAVLASQKQDPSTLTLLNVLARLNDLITNVLSKPSWQTTGGIITNGGSYILVNSLCAGKNGDSILVRALTAAYVRNVTTPDIRKILRDYISVQFNAVKDLATNGDNIYGAQWIGPASSVFSENSQTSALSPLLSTVYLIASDMNITASSTTTSSTSPEQSPTPSSTPSKAPAPATIAGPVIGAVLVVAIGIVVCLIVRRRRARARELLAPEPMPTAQLAPTSIPTTSVAAQPQSNPFFADSSADRSFNFPSHPSVVPPTDFSFMPRSYVGAEKRRPPPRHVPQQSEMSATSTGGNSFPGTAHSTSAAAFRDSQVVEEEPPPEYVAKGR
ncbi:hypothetical protein DFH08DRAFT_935093 [Mycena albidolilacea]|uniref:Glycoside hydrolase family 76 protein n=1 Tax=Mycena albidolilacea TaxID=1033008 RepID=A0AAD7A7U6_9AGAR|nr:hypothetical protein DFH08DRAFT_935093 [Mycena albidolilacea]